MSKIEQQYEKILNLCDKSEINEINTKTLVPEVFELAKLIDNTQDADFTWNDDFTADVYGTSNTHTISLNSKLIDVCEIPNLIVTIFHEARHIYQFKTTKNKIDKYVEPCMPVYFCTDSIMYLSGRDLNLNYYDVYYTSWIEKDARDTSINRAKELCGYLYYNIKHENSKQFFGAVCRSLKKMQEDEKVNYANSMFGLTYNKQAIKTHATKEIEQEIEKFKNENGRNCDYIFQKIYAMTIIYCDEEIKQKIKKSFKPYIKHVKEVFFSYLHLFNFPFWNTTSQDMYEIFDIAKSLNIPLFAISNALQNFDIQDITEVYAHYLTKDKKYKKILPFFKTKNSDKTIINNDSDITK